MLEHLTVEDFPEHLVGFVDIIDIDILRRYISFVIEIIYIFQVKTI